MSTVTTVQIKHRPILVSLLAIVLVIWGILLVIGGLGLLFFSWWTQFGHNYEIAGLTGPLAGLVTVIVGLIYIGLYLGLWRMRLWAWVVALLVSLGWVIGTGTTLTSGSPSWAGFIISILILVYLFVVLKYFRGMHVVKA